MPVSANRAEVGLAAALDASQQRSIEGVGLGAIPALAGAHALSLFLRGLFHGWSERRQVSQPCPAGASRAWADAKQKGNSGRHFIPLQFDTPKFASAWL
jgi:hypothetical protein